MAPIDLRSPIDILSDRIQLPTNDTVELCHPGYRHLAPVKRIMLRLPAFDSLAHSNHQSRGTKAYGLHYSTAAAACMIISGNREGVLCSKLMSQPEFRTFIAKSSGCEHNPDDPTISKQDSRNLPSPDMLLTGQRYYFYPSGWHKDPSPDYPVCPKFRDWGFDHGGFDHGAHLQQWKSDVPGDSLVLAFDESTDESEVSIFVKMRDGACKISGFKDSTESAHLVPEDHKRWYTKNSMSVYCREECFGNSNPSTDISNLLTLRSDIVKSFDTQHFVFVPKGGVYCVHFLRRSDDLGPLYHNRKVPLLASVVSPAFLYSRFAWAVLALAGGFTSQPGIAVQVWDDDDNAWKMQHSELGVRSKEGNGWSG